jgi:hypothetical protein
MTYKELKSQIKQELKEAAQSIRQGKVYRKPANRKDMPKEHISKYCYTYGQTTYYAQDKVNWLSNDFRHKHIAYCHFFNGTEYGLIENPRSGNERKQSIIDAYIKSWESELDEVVRDCA